MDDRYFAIIPGVFLLLFFTIGIMLLCGKWSKVIPGYNRKATNQDAKFFEKIVCRYAGIYTIIATLFFIPIFAGIILQNSILAGVSAGFGICYALFGYVALVNNTRIKRSVYLAKNLEQNPNALDKEELEKWRNELGFTKRTHSKNRQK